MVVACAVPAAVVLRKVPPLPGPRLVALIGVEAVGLSFVAIAALTTFVRADAIGLPPGEMCPFLVVMFGFIVLAKILTVTIVLIPAIQRGAGERADGSGPIRRG